MSSLPLETYHHRWIVLLDDPGQRTLDLAFLLPRTKSQIAREYPNAFDIQPDSEAVNFPAAHT